MATNLVFFLLTTHKTFFVTAALEVAQQQKEKGQKKKDVCSAILFGVYYCHYFLRFDLHFFKYICIHISYSFSNPHREKRESTGGRKSSSCWRNDEGARLPRGVKVKKKETKAKRQPCNQKANIKGQ